MDLEKDGEKRRGGKTKRRRKGLRGSGKVVRVETSGDMVIWPENKEEGEKRI